MAGYYYDCFDEQYDCCIHIGCFSDTNFEIEENLSSYEVKYFHDIILVTAEL
jgi:hypothetical protein